MWSWLLLSCFQQPAVVVWVSDCCSCSAVRSCPTLWPHGLQQARLICPSLSPGVCSNSCPLSQWCYLTISPSAAPLSFCFNLFQNQGVFQWVGSSHQVAKVLELQLQHQSFQWTFRVDVHRIDWLDLLAVQGTLKSLLQHNSSKASVWHSALFMVQLLHPCDYLKNHSFDYTKLCQHSDVSAF